MRLALALLLAIPLAAHAQPAFFEPPQGYYKARGARVTATWTVDRTTLPEDGGLSATLTIAGADNPREVIRPDLAKIRDDEGRFPFADRFQIENAPGLGDIKTATFVYRLRPRNADVNRLPTLTFYYDSGVKVGNPFKPAFAKGIDLTVTRVAKPKPPVVPLLEPDKLFAIETGPRVLAREPFEPGWISWLALFAFGLVVPVVWYGVWRRVYPDGARLAQLRRNRALRRATDAIRKANRSADPAGAIAAAVLGYLRTRFPLTAGAETPGEVAESLRKAGAAESDAAAEFLRRCDEARFSPASDNPLSLADEARNLLARLEAAE